MAHWNIEHRVFAVEQFLETVIPQLLSNVFSVESSMLSVKVQFQMETLYSYGLKHLELPDLSETFHSSRNRSSATKNGACVTEL
jgi:hypothetical protein